MADGCCPPVACETMATCCGEGGSDVVSVDSAATVEQVGEEVESVVVDQPTPAAAVDSVATGGLEPVAPPLPELRSLRVGDAVVPASNDQPVIDAPAATPAANEGPAEADPAPADEPEMREDAALPAESRPDDPTDEPTPAEETPAGETPPAVPPIPGLDDEPPMEEDADPADEPVPAPEPAAEPEPEPAEPNLFEEFEDEDAPADEDVSADEEEMADEEEASNPFADDEPEAAAADEEMADEPSDPLADEEMADEEMADEPLPDDADPFGDAPSDDPETLDEPGPLEEDEVMVDDSEELPAADAGEDEPAPADPFADDEPTPPMDDDEPEPEPAAGEDPLASAEPKRRWIHASGAHSLVATLVDVAGDGSCVLMTEGRQIRVPLDNLSGHDRDYVRDAGVRLAAVKGLQERAAEAASTAAPAATDTAGM